MLPLATYNWLQALLRLLGRLRALMLGAAAYSLAVCAMAWLLAPHGVTAVAAAWPAGGLVGAAVSALPGRGALRRTRQEEPPGPDDSISGKGRPMAGKGREISGAGRQTAPEEALETRGKYAK